MNDAWMTGIFEGEGCITMQGRGPRPLLQVKMTDKDVVQRFMDVAGAGQIHEEERPPHKLAYVWRTGKQDAVVNILERMLPFLGERRALKALNTFDFYDGCYNCNPPEAIALG